MLTYQPLKSVYGHTYGKRADIDTGNPIYGVCIIALDGHAPIVARTMTVEGRREDWHLRTFRTLDDAEAYARERVEFVRKAR